MKSIMNKPRIRTELLLGNTDHPDEIRIRVSKDTGQFNKRDNSVLVPIVQAVVKF